MRPVPTPVFQTREQLVYDYLRRAIVQGTWGPDDPIVTSRVAADLGVSRITIANALKRLAGEGFVRLTPHKEAFVARITADEVEEIYLMRAALEAEAAASACARATAADLAELHRLNQRLGSVERDSDVAVVRAADHAFHARLRAIAGMPRLAQTIANLADLCEYYRARLLDTSHLAVPTAAGHQELLQALEARDVERVRAFAREHVLRGMRTVLAALEATR